MPRNEVVSAEQWVAARKKLLNKEKEFTRLRDELTRLRQDLPWEKVEKNYTFDGPDGPSSLADLFDGRSQLLVYHFMFDPDWEEGCKSCSLLADHYYPAVIHLKQRDVTMVTISRTPLEKLQAFQKRMGWAFTWVSSLNSDFNWDYNVSFTQEQLDGGEACYNYEKGKAFPVREAPGLSAFYKDETGAIFHTYSCFARGLETFIGAYWLLDVVPKGRDEADLNYGMEWVRHHDRYEDSTFIDPYVNLVKKKP